MTGWLINRCARRFRAGVLAGVLAALAVSGCVAVGPAAGPPGAPPTAGSPGPASGEQATELSIPSPQAGVAMRAQLFRPTGNGPFPLAVISHGSEQDPALRARLGRPSFPELTSFLLEKGYVVVLPQRPGHGSTGGRYLEDQGSCAGADFRRAGEGAADSIAATVAFMTKQPYVRPTGIVIAGHSAGAWGSLAYAARNPAGLRAVVDFAGGRGGRNYGRANDNCAPERLVATAAEFGRGARVPTLWLYAENDTYFAPELARRLAEAYSAAGGNVTFKLYPATGGDGHFLIRSTVWRDELEAFLAGTR